MEIGRNPRRARVGAIGTLVVLLLGLFVVLAQPARADEIGPGTDIDGFEIDGKEIDNPDFGKPGEPEKITVSAANYAFDGTGTVDWSSIPDLEQYLHFDDPFVDGDDGEDQGFEGGDKEFEPSGWGCAADSGDDPLKDDLHYLLAYPSVDIDNAVVAFSYVREKPEGNTNVVIEFNRSSLDSCNAAAGRSVGDLILHFDFPGGDEPADLEAYVWNGSAMVNFDVPAGVANAATNDEDLAVPAAIEDEVTGEGLSDTVLAREMGEAVIDLEALRDALQADPDIGSDIPDDILECPGIGFANVRTRSSGEANTSQLHDNFPEIPINLSNCGSLELKKVDDLGAPMEGVQFGLFETEEDAEAGEPVAQLPTDPPEDLVCTTDADGICEFTRVPPGDYWLNEIDLSDDYTADPDLPAAVSIDAFEDVDWTDDDNEACAADIEAEGCEWFVNTLKTGTVVITKQVVDGEGEPLTPSDITYLDGITFELQDGGSTVQKRSGGDATCTLELDDPTDDPSCEISDVPFGTYDVVEDPTTLPAGLGAGPSVEVTVDEESPATAEVTYENPADPLDISIDKTGPNTANVGDTITYTFTVGLGDLPFDTTDDVDLQPLTDVAVTEVISAPDYDDRCTESALVNTDKEDIGPLGDDWLEEGERWTYECTHTVTAAEAFDDDGTDLKNRAHVSGTDRYDREATDTDDHVVEILLPDLAVEKLAVDGLDDDSAASADETVDAPGAATYSIVVTNEGDGNALDATLTDELPAGAWTVTLLLPDGDDSCPTGPNPISGSFTCTFGTLAPGDSKTISVTRTVAIEDGCDAVLENNAGVSTVYEEQDLDTDDSNDSSSATIRLRCPIEIDLDKTGDTIAHVGDTVDYEFTVTNTGGEDLVDVELVDPECNEGTITLVDDGDGDDNLAAGTWDGDSFEGGEVWSYTCQRTITAEDVVVVDGQDLALNTGEVTAEDEDGRPVDDTDPHEVLIITPDIEIVKTVDDETPEVGQTVTYTYVVTNTGNTTLFGVDVTDDILGEIGTIDELEPGESATLTKTMVVATDSPTRNVATADGEDVLGKHVDDDDDAEITIVLGNVVVPRAPLPRTGMDLDRLLGLAGALLVLGGVLLLTRHPAAAPARRRRR